jgi:uncharacterized protein DUF4058
MPLRDHFRDSLPEPFHWEGFHSAWANTMVRHLNQHLLPARYRAEPHTHLGSQAEVDIGSWETELDDETTSPAKNGASAVWAPPQPVLTLQTDLDDPDIFEVKVYDELRESHLVAAIELVSPGNKDREAQRRDFVLKCASYLRTGVALIVIDIVTSRRQNLFESLVELLKVAEIDGNWEPSDLYAFAMKPEALPKGWRVRTWPFTLCVGEQLPTLPLWLAEQFAVPLDLEAGYEETCKVLRA